MDESHLNRKLGDDKVKVSRKLIGKHILLEGVLALTFTGTWIRDRAIVFDCSNQESTD